MTDHRASDERHTEADSCPCGNMVRGYVIHAGVANVHYLPVVVIVQGSFAFRMRAWQSAVFLHWLES